MSSPLSGVIGACLTPFDSAGAVDLTALAAQLDYLAEDADAIAVGAVEASEYRVLDDDTRHRLLGDAVRLVDGRVPVIAGASDPTARGVIARIESAAELGAGFAQVLIPPAPWAGAYTHDQLVDYFGLIDEAAVLPVVAYQNPSTGTDLSIATYVELSKYDSIIAFKESSRDLSKITRLITLLQPQAAYFTTMQPMLITLMLGGAGATMPPPGTRVAAHIRDAHRAGDLDLALAWQQVFSFFPGKWGHYGLAPLMKTAMRHVGVEMGSAVAPRSRLTDADEAELAGFIRGCGITTLEPASVDVLKRLAGISPA